MKTKTIEKAVKNSKKNKKAYSTSEIREAIAYWKGRLASLNESGDETEEDDVEDDEDDVDTSGGDSGEMGLPDEDSVESKAKASPVGVFNPTKRFYRMHLHAEKVVKEKLGKLLNKSKMGDGESVVIENSAIEDGDFDINADEITVTVKVLIDKAKVQGFRKFIAVLKEEELQNPDLIDEASLWGEIFKGVANTAKGVNKAAKEKIADANEQLKQRVGVTAMQEYFKAFFGMILAKKITPKCVFAGADEEGTAGAQFIYCSSVKLKH